MSLKNYNDNYNLYEGKERKRVKLQKREQKGHGKEAGKIV